MKWSDNHSWSAKARDSSALENVGLQTEAGVTFSLKSWAEIPHGAPMSSQFSMIEILSKGPQTG